MIIAPDGLSGATNAGVLSLWMESWKEGLVMERKQSHAWVRKRPCVILARPPTLDSQSPEATPFGDCFSGELGEETLGGTG